MEYGNDGNQTHDKKKKKKNKKKKKPATLCKRSELRRDVAA